MKVTQQQANEDFAERVQSKYLAWCRKKGKINNTKNFIKFLVRHRFVDTPIINRFLSVEHYKEEFPKTKNDKWIFGRKIVAIHTIEDRLPISETQIKSNVNNHYVYFRDRPHKFK